MSDQSAFIYRVQGFVAASIFYTVMILVIPHILSSVRGTVIQCGNLVCEASETCSTCPGDCGYCAPPPPPPLPTYETSCTDGVDNDGDMAADCVDADCSSDPACAPPPPPPLPTYETSCTDGVDNDGDMAADCVDTDCSSDPACGGVSHNAAPSGSSFFFG